MNKKKTSKKTLLRLLNFTKPYTFFLVITIIGALISSLATLFAPVLIGEVIDNIIAEGIVNFDLMIPSIIYLAITVAVGAVFQWIMQLSITILTQRTVKDLRISVFNKLQNLPLSYSDRTPHGEIISRIITDIDSISDGLLQGFQQLFTGLITIIGTLFFMINVNPPIALVVILITPLSLIVASTIARLCSKKFKEQAALRGEITSLSNEMIGNIKIVKAFATEQDNENKFEELNQKLKKVGQKAQFYSSLTNPSTRFVNGLVYSGVGIFGALSAVTGGITVGQLSCFLSYANQYTKPFNEISGVFAELQSAFASAARVFEIIDTEDEISDANLPELTDVHGNIEISNVDFSYTADKPLIQNFNLSVKSGQQIAIVGPTGCGKTTLINLLLRFYDIDKGSITVDEKSINQVTRESLRLNYGMVLQETWIFKGTVKENISYGKPDASDEDIIKAAKSAHCHSFIKKLKKGYDTVISENSGLSQGQKQLLCIARVMLTMPPMLILDEATSNIDTRTEIKIQNAFAKMTENKTSFIVAHRLSTIKSSDCIIVMNKGQIIETGNHEQLLDKQGFYYELYNSQFKKT